jgi:hypothetical protein
MHEARPIPLARTQIATLMRTPGNPLYVAAAEVIAALAEVAAQTAIDDEIVGLDLIEGGAILEEHIIFAVADEAGHRTALELGSDGRLTARAQSLIGVPNGGVAGHALTKLSGSNADTTWATPSPDAAARAVPRALVSFAGDTAVLQSPAGKRDLTPVGGTPVFTDGELPGSRALRSTTGGAGYGFSARYGGNAYAGTIAVRCTLIAPATANAFIVYHNVAGVRVHLYRSSAGSLIVGLGDSANVLSVSAPPLDTWATIGLTWDNEIATLFVNGEQVGTATYTGPLKLGTMYVGTNNLGSEPGHVDIAGVAFFPRALTSDDHASLADATLWTIPSPELWAGYRRSGETLRTDPWITPANIAPPMVPDTVFEWWIQPSAMYQATPYPRTVFGGISGAGEVIAGEFDHATGRVRRYTIGTVTVDDHSPASVWVQDGHRPVAVWANHNYDTTMRIKIGSRSGDLGSLVNAPLVEVEIGSGCSYNHLYRIASRSDGFQDTFWAFTRTGSSTGWSIHQFSVDQNSGAYTAGFIQQIISAGRPYAATSSALNESGEQVIRMAICLHPNEATAPLYYLEINAETGTITTPADGSVAANVDGTNLPIVLSGVTPEIPAATSPRKRWIYAVRSGPDTAALAYSEFDPADPDSGEYWVYEVGGSATSLGAPGAPFYVVPYSGDQSTYLPGLAFESPSYDLTVIRARDDGTTTYLEKLRPDGDGGYTVEVLLSHDLRDGRFVRPVAPHGGGPFLAVAVDMLYYGNDYSSYFGNLVGA